MAPSRRLPGFSQEVVEYLERRAAEIYKATQRKGMPMTYGTGKPPEKAKKKR